MWQRLKDKPGKRQMNLGKSLDIVLRVRKLLDVLSSWTLFTVSSIDQCPSYRFLINSQDTPFQVLSLILRLFNHTINMNYILHFLRVKSFLSESCQLMCFTSLSIKITPPTHPHIHTHIQTHPPTYCPICVNGCSRCLGKKSMPYYVVSKLKPIPGE